MKQLLHAHHYKIRLNEHISPHKLAYFLVVFIKYFSWIYCHLFKHVSDIEVCLYVKKLPRAHLKARLDHSEGQHADASHGSGPRSQQNCLSSVGRALQEVVLLQGVEGAEVDAHAGNAAHK